MEGDSALSATQTPAPAPATCPTCHQGLRPEWYFCPNCGTNIHPAPLSTTLTTQLIIYAHSVILPMFLFFSISKWKGYTYFKSDDPVAKQIGTVAVVLFVLSTLVTFWLAYVWTQDAIQSSIDSINADMSI